MRGFRGLTPEWARRLQEAIPEAFARVVDTAIENAVDFVLIAGDSFDTSGASYGDYLRYFAELQRLDDAGIPVYLTTGNHDPFSQWKGDAWKLPPSAHLLGGEAAEFALFERDGEPLCLIGARGYRNQAWPMDESVVKGLNKEQAVAALASCNPRAEEAPFFVGMLHTGLDIDQSKAYANPEALLAADADMWACGHLHRHFCIPPQGDARIVFPGCIQGRDLKESGERGCYLVTLREVESALRAVASAEFVPTASVVFHTVKVDVTQCQTLSDVHWLAMGHLFAENGKSSCDEMVVRIVLEGTTDLHEFLKQPSVRSDLKKRINSVTPFFYCDAIEDRTSYVLEGCQPDESALCSRVIKASEERKADRAGMVADVQLEFVRLGIDVPSSLSRKTEVFAEVAQVCAYDFAKEFEDEDECLCALDQEICKLAGDQDQRGTVAQLADTVEEQTAQVRAASDSMALARRQDRRRDELVRERAGIAAELERIDAQLEESRLVANEIDDLDERIELYKADSKAFEAALGSARADEQKLRQECGDDALVALDSAAERALSDTIADYSEERAKLTRSIDAAREQSVASSATYEALLEVDEEEAIKAKSLSQRKPQIAVSVLLTIIFIGAGVPTFAQGRHLHSFSLTVLGIGLVIMACCLAIAALAVLLRPNRGAELLERRRRDAQWVMLQDEKKLKARLAERDDLDSEIGEFLRNSGLEQAGGSLRQARMLLESAREARAKLSRALQKQDSLSMRLNAANRKVQELEEKRAELGRKIDLGDRSPAAFMESLSRTSAERRDALTASAAKCDTELEELNRTLAQLQDDRSFDALKFERCEGMCRLRDEKHKLVVLLLARDLLERARTA